MKELSTLRRALRKRKSSGYVEELKAQYPELLEPRHGIYLVEPHGRMLVEGSKKAMVKSVKFEAHLGEPLFILSGAYCYGIIQYDEIKEIDLKQFKELQPIHKVSDAERLKWWKEKEKLYFYPIKVLGAFDPPKRYKRLWGIQTFVEDVKFLKEERAATTEEMDLKNLEILAIEETENEVRARIQSPNKYDPDSFRRGPFPPTKPTKGVFAIYACPKGEWSKGRCQVGVQIQALRFVKKDGWTIGKAKTWLNTHGFKVLEVGEKSRLQELMEEEIKGRISLLRKKEELISKIMEEDTRA